jgi:hypothetical protein
MGSHIRRRREYTIMKATVRITKSYGIERIYPVCSTASIFAGIAGTKTLSRFVINEMKALGFEVEVEQQKL